METAAAFECTYSDWRIVKGRKVVQIVLEIPIEHSDRAYTVLGGMPNPAAEVWCGVARLINRQQQEVKSGIAAGAVEPRSPPEGRLTQRAVMMCKDIRFHRYMVERYGPVAGNLTAKEWATNKLRELCGVKSRAEIKPETEAADRLDWLESRYIAWRVGPRAGAI